MDNSITRCAGGGMEDEMTRAWANQRAAAQNIANADTPGFVGKRIVRDPAAFPGFLAAELDRTDKSHLPEVNPSPVPGSKEETVPNISLDVELSEVAKNQLLYGTLAEVATRWDHMARVAIAGR